LSISVCDLNYYFDFLSICNLSKNNNIYIVSSGDNIGKPCLPAYLDSVLGVGVARLPVNEYMFNEQEQIQFYANGEYNDLERSNSYSNIHQTSFATVRITGLICKILFEENIENYVDLIPILKMQSAEFNIQNIIVKNHYFDLSKHTKMISFRENDILNSLKSNEIIFISSYMESLFLKNYGHSNFPIVDIYSIERDKEMNLFESRGIPTFHLPPIENEKTNINILIGDIPLYLLSQVVDKFPFHTLYTLSYNHICKNINIEYCFRNLEEIERILNNISSEHIFSDTKPNILFLNLSSIPNLIEFDVFIRDTMNNQYIDIGQISDSTMSTLFDIDYSYERFINSEKKYIYIKTIIDKFNRNNVNAIFMDINYPYRINENKKINEFLYINYIASILSFSSDYIFLIIDELTTIDIIKNCICNLKTLCNSKIIAAVVMDFFASNNCSDFFTETELNMFKVLKKKDVLANKLQKIEELANNILFFNDENDKIRLGHLVTDLIY
jgi:hypothetical protein